MNYGEQSKQKYIYDRHSYGKSLQSKYCLGGKIAKNQVSGCASAQCTQRQAVKEVQEKEQAGETEKHLVKGLNVFFLQKGQFG